MSSVCRKSRKNLGSSSGCLEAGTAERASRAGYFLRTLDLLACTVTGQHVGMSMWQAQAGLAAATH